jgi:DNA-binding transcriptional LysR family regulator
MNRNELRKADINLMVVFEALMLERNVTRVAEKLFLGQPTISSALNRLRTLFNDPLFIASATAWSRPREPRRSSSICRRRWIRCRWP